MYTEALFFYAFLTFFPVCVPEMFFKNNILENFPIPILPLLSQTLYNKDSFFIKNITTLKRK